MTQFGSKAGAISRKRDVILLRLRSIQWLERYALVILFVIVCGLFGIFGSDKFLSIQNAQDIAGNQVVLGILALAVIIPLVCGQFDLSVGAVLGLSNIVFAAAMSVYSVPILPAALIAILSGGAVGLVNGLLVARVKVNSLITTLGMATVISGVVGWYTEGQQIARNIPNLIVDLGTGFWFGIPIGVYLLVVAALLVWYLLEYTPFGRYLHAVGSNEVAARVSGLKVNRLVLMSFVISGLVAGLAGVVQVARIGAGQPSIGPNYLLPALSAAFLGATAIQPGRYNVWGTIVAVFFIAVSVSGLALAGAPYYVGPIFTGGALVIAVAVSTLIARRRVFR